MILIFAATDISADLWIDSIIEILGISTALGAKVYPLLAAIGLIKALIKYF